MDTEEKESAPFFSLWQFWVCMIIGLIVLNLLEASLMTFAIFGGFFGAIIIPLIEERWGGK